ncbi:MAG: hypothetical protein JWO26_1113 [Rhodospirillales bacterium]|nr:hypothetical protein [Rhodospirillales bacterium]
MMSEEGFLSRWSQRKRATLRGDAPPEPTVAEPDAKAGAFEASVGAAPAGPLVVAPEAALQTPAALAEEETPFDPASLPPLESLTAESDFLPFLARNVPALLKRDAMRRMWSLDIGIRDYVGPSDYAWDYNAVGGVPGSSLDLIGDIQKHLAQAIGAMPPPDEGDAAPKESLAEVPEPAPVRRSAALPESPPEAPATAPEAEPRPRRHGAAAPG